MFGLHVHVRFLTGYPKGGSDEVERMAPTCGQNEFYKANSRAGDRTESVIHAWPDLHSFSDHNS